MKKFRTKTKMLESTSGGKTNMGTSSVRFLLRSWILRSSSLISPSIFWRAVRVISLPSYGILSKFLPTTTKCEMNRGMWLHHGWRLLAHLSCYPQFGHQDQSKQLRRERVIYIAFSRTGKWSKGGDSVVEGERSVVLAETRSVTNHLTCTCTSSIAWVSAIYIMMMYNSQERR